MKETVYLVLCIIFWIIGIVLGSIALLIDMVFAYKLYGIIGIIIGASIFPVMLFAMPFIELIVYGFGISLVLSIVSIVFMFIASILNEK